MALDLNLGANKERLLVIGAKGWFGREAISLGLKAGMNILACGSQPGEVSVGEMAVKVHECSNSLIKKFSPSLVIDTAFITRDRIDELGKTAYISKNRELIQKSIEISKLDSVDTYIGFSSGATQHLAGMQDFTLSNNPYSFLKKEYEDEIANSSKTSEKKISLARVWSVSGPFCTKPETFALQNFINQAKTGRVSISTPHKVFRRYVPVSEVILLARKFAVAYGANIFDTGGPLVEIGDLARIVIDVVNPKGLITRPEIVGTYEDDYFSDGTAWQSMLVKLNAEEMSIREQVERSIFQTS